MSTRIRCEPGDFTARELEILNLLSHGKNRKEIAKELFISPSTVHTHQKHIYRKMDAHNVHEVVAYALMDGLIV